MFGVLKSVIMIIANPSSTVVTFTSERSCCSSLAANWPSTFNIKLFHVWFCYETSFSCPNMSHFCSKGQEFEMDRKNAELWNEFNSDWPPNSTFESRTIFHGFVPFMRVVSKYRCWVVFVYTFATTSNLCLSTSLRILKLRSGMFRCFNVYFIDMKLQINWIFFWLRHDVIIQCIIH